ncbi:MAG: OmpA/MotB family protein [Saprospiraceae bacterium]|jgi:flagellar motor protein MotB
MAHKIFYFLILQVILVSCIGKKKHLEQIQALKNSINATSISVSETLDSLGILEQSLRLQLAEKTGENNILNLLREELAEDIEVLENQIASLIDNANDQEKVLRNRVVSLQSHIEKKENQLENVEILLAGYGDLFQEIKDSIEIPFRIDSMEGVTLSVNPFELVLTFQEELIFEKGSLAVSEEGYGTLDSLARIIEPFLKFKVEIQVHTDTERPNRKFKNNWDFSMGRAAVLADFFIGEKGFSATRLSASGQADFLPMESNSDEDGRQKNRRISFMFRPQNASLVRDIREILSQR